MVRTKMTMTMMIELLVSLFEFFRSMLTIQMTSEFLSGFLIDIQVNLNILCIQSHYLIRNGPDESMTDQLIEASQNLMLDLEALSDHQSFMRSRERDHRELSEKIFARVVRWTLLEAVVLIVVSGGQVVYLRKFFEKRRRF
uniref:GOLD domain-containing protein n=1 Tax=Corethron hystrix TaxID=216773 RepID=A0A7S1FVF3_9STRA|mmetsp:Transcript_35051/g.81074  ORF Transcript_35051/g.81074 Transcript_35051/m.81074 type:complete len:141 (+) Transcript_35051:478-900(+)